MNRNYADEKETHDYELLCDFNSYLKLNGLGRMIKDYSSDASGVTTDGRILNIELKSRNATLTKDMKVMGYTKEGRVYTVDTLYIESHKIGELYTDYFVTGMIPMYINFLEGGYVVVYNLLHIKRMPKRVTKKIWSELYQALELAKREELSLEDAWIYKKEDNVYKLIHKP